MIIASPLYNMVFRYLLEDVEITRLDSELRKQIEELKKRIKP